MNWFYFASVLYFSVMLLGLWFLKTGDKTSNDDLFIRRIIIFWPIVLALLLFAFIVDILSPERES